MTAQIGNPDDVVVGDGQTLRIVCDVMGSNVNIVWFGPDGSSVGSGNRLVISEFNRDKVGRYTCEATNSDGKDSEQITTIMRGRVTRRVETRQEHNVVFLVQRVQRLADLGKWSPRNRDLSSIRIKSTLSEHLPMFLVATKWY